MNRQEAETILRIGAQRYHGWGYHDFLKLISYSVDRTVTGQEGTVYALKISAERFESNTNQPTEADAAESEGDGAPPPMPSAERGFVLVRFVVRDQEDRARFRPSLVASLLIGPDDVFDGEFDELRHRFAPRLIYRTVQLSLVAGGLALAVAAGLIMLGQ